MNEYEFINESVREIREFMAKIYFDDSLLLTEDIFIDGQPKDKVFFKVFRTKSIDETGMNRICSGVCRISIDKPEYITGYDENIILTNDEIDRIIYGLTRNNNAGWKYLLEQTNYSLEAINMIDKLYDVDNYPIPDYNLLKQ